MTHLGETQAVFDDKLKRWVAHWKPVSPVERELVRRIAQHDVLVHRVLSAQNHSLAQNAGAPTPELLQWLKFQAIQERSLLDCTAMLQDLRDFKLIEANGFVSQKDIKAKKPDPNEGNPWMNMDLDPETENGWADPITGKFTSFGDGFASEVAEEQALKEAERLREAEREKDPAA